MTIAMDSGQQFSNSAIVTCQENVPLTYLNNLVAKNDGKLVIQYTVEMRCEPTKLPGTEILTEVVLKEEGENNEARGRKRTKKIT